jgi:hypothetical protein
MGSASIDLFSLKVSDGNTWTAEIAWYPFSWWRTDPIWAPWKARRDHLYIPHTLTCLVYVDVSRIHTLTCHVPVPRPPHKLPTSISSPRTIPIIGYALILDQTAYPLLPPPPVINMPPPCLPSRVRCHALLGRHRNFEHVLPAVGMCYDYSFFNRVYCDELVHNCYVRVLFL